MTQYKKDIIFETLRLAGYLLLLDSMSFFFTSFTGKTLLEDIARAALSVCAINVIFLTSFIGKTLLLKDYSRAALLVRAEGNCKAIYLYIN